MEKHLKVGSFQETLNSGYCGPAALKIVLAYYGVDISEEELAKRTNTTKELGTTAEDIKRVAEELGFSVVIKNESSFGDIEKYLSENVPVIVDWFTSGGNDYPEEIDVPDGHYSVVCGIDEEYIYLQDPEIGRVRKLKKDAFENVWFDFSGERVNSWEEMIVRQIIAIYPAYNTETPKI